MSEATKILLGFSTGTLLTSVGYSFTNKKPNLALRAANSVAGSIALSQQIDMASVMAPLIGSAAMDAYALSVGALGLDHDTGIILGTLGSVFVGSIATFIAAKALT